jgi:hypothetical protein
MEFVAFSAQLQGKMIDHPASASYGVRKEDISQDQYLYGI